VQLVSASIQDTLKTDTEGQRENMSLFQEVNGKSVELIQASRTAEDWVAAMPNQLKAPR
jgi:hypothetical protein